MKKIISIVLTICMLFSMISVVSASDISEDERLALLNEKDYTYIDINPNIDAFASAEVIRDYAVFETATDDSAFNTLHTEDGISYRTRIPSKTHSGVEITGNESYYYKGIGYFNVDETRIYSSQRHAPLLFATESFKLSADELKELKLNYYKNIAKATTSKMVAAEPEKYTTATFSFPNKDNGYDFMPIVDDIEYAGENYSVILKDNNSTAKIKIGPMNDKEFVKNAVDYIGGGTSPNHIVSLPEGVKGDSIAIAATTGNVNDGGSVPAMSFTPAAALLPIEIKYADGTAETKQMVMTSMGNANDMASAAIVYGDKYDNGREIDYSTETDFYSKLEKTTGLTFADVTFPENVSAGEINLGFALRASQSDNYTDFSNQVNLGTFDLQDKEIKTIRFINDMAPGDNPIEGIISLKSNNVRALVPVTVENGDADKVYFLYVGRITQQPAVLGATVINKSLQDKIDAINDRLDLVTEETIESECEAIDKAILALKAESEYIEDKDFNQEKYAIVKEKLLAIALGKVEKVEGAIKNLANTYTYEMKAKLLEVYADYMFLFENGIDKSQVDAECRDKIEALYAAYEKANALETLAAGWDVYSYSMYDEVVKASEDLAEMPDAVSAETAETVAAYLEKATTAKAIDDKIAELPSVYDSSMLEKVLAIEDEIDAYVENGGSLEAFKNYESLKKLIDSAASDVLKADIAEAEKLINELPKTYSTSLKDKVAEIVAAVESIETRGGQLGTEEKAKFDKILAQRDEKSTYRLLKLNYTRDVFEDVKAYAAQGYADKDKGVYVYPEGAWRPSVSLVAGATKFAFDEVGFVTALKLDDKNKGVTAGIPYQYGPIISKVHGKANEPNSINAADCENNIIKIDVTPVPYEELYLAAWAKKNDTSATIKYIYADGSTSLEQNLKGILGGYNTGKPNNNDYATVMHDAGVSYWRAYDSSATNDKVMGWGGYSIYVSSHKLTPDDTKALKSIEITVSDQDVNIFALTGKAANSGIISDMLDETMAAFENENTPDEVRNLVISASNYMTVLDYKGVAYDPSYKETCAEYNEKYIRVANITSSLDVDKRTIKVSFTGAIAPESVTKENFKLQKHDGKNLVDVSNYEVKLISDKVVEISCKNSFDYDCTYAIIVNKGILNAEKTIDLGTTWYSICEDLPPVDVKVTYENNEVKIKVKNNTDSKLENFVVMVGAFDKDNALVKFEPVAGALEAGAEFNQTIAFADEAEIEKIVCEVIDTLDTAKFLFGQIRIK